MMPAKLTGAVAGLLASWLFMTLGCVQTGPVLLAPLQPDKTSQLAENLTGYRAVCIGEAHTAALHHENQLKIIRGLHNRGTEVAIGLEMFPFTSQQLLDRWVDGSIDIGQFKKGYSMNWQIPFDMYKDIFLYAREKQIPLLGLNVPRGVASKVARQGFHTLTVEEKIQLPDSISCKPNTPQMTLLRNVLVSRGASFTMFQRFCEAHSLRDKTMALYAAHYLEKHPDTTMVILAGINHCEKQGTPGYLEELTEQQTVVILPAVSKEILQLPITTDNADYLLAE